jgi:hypothetical protein
VSGVLSDVVEEAERVSDEVGREGLPYRLLGGLAVRLRAKNGLDEAFRRNYADLDFIIPKGESKKAQTFFENVGYVPQTRFNTIYGNERLLFMDEKNGRQVDVLVGKFRMCHEVPFGKRLAIEPRTVPLAELLLTKMQIIELNEKDVRDTLALLHDHEVADEDGDSINGERIARICASDWGLWRTFTGNLEDLRGRVENYDISEGGKDNIEERIGILKERVEVEPKTFGWKVRAKIGERKRWYELPEEVEGGP